MGGIQLVTAVCVSQSVYNVENMSSSMTVQAVYEPLIKGTMGAPFSATCRAENLWVHRRSSYAHSPAEDKWERIHLLNVFQMSYANSVQAMVYICPSFSFTGPTVLLD